MTATQNQGGDRGPENLALVAFGVGAMDAAGVVSLVKAHDGKAHHVEGNHEYSTTDNYAWKTYSEVVDGHQGALHSLPAPELGFLALGIAANVAVARGMGFLHRRRSS